MKRGLLKITLRIGLVVSIAYIAYAHYITWNNKAGLFAWINMEVKPVLTMIQHVQQECIAKHGCYCQSISFVVETAKKVNSNKFIDELGKLESQLEDKKPSLAAKRETKYYYAIVSADRECFLAEAHLKKNVLNGYYGDDIWQIGKSGLPSHVVESWIFEKRFPLLPFIFIPIMFLLIDVYISVRDWKKLRVRLIRLALLLLAGWSIFIGYAIRGGGYDSWWGKVDFGDANSIIGLLIMSIGICILIGLIFWDKRSLKPR